MRNLWVKFNLRVEWMIFFSIFLMVGEKRGPANSSIVFATQIYLKKRIEESAFISRFFKNFGRNFSSIKPKFLNRALFKLPLE